MNPKPASGLPFGTELILIGWVMVAVALFPVVEYARGGNSGTQQPHIGVELWSSQDSVAQLYYDTGAGFNEAQSETALIKKDLLNRLIFSVPAPAVKEIRFDPLMTGGTVRIVRLWCENAESTRRVPLALDAFEPANQIAALHYQDSVTTVVMPPGANDPQLLLRFSKPLVFPRSTPPWGWIAALVAGAGLMALGWLRGDRRRPVVGTTASLLGAAIVAFVWLWPLHRTLDYPLWDEANYLGWGRMFLTTKSLGGISGSPVYQLWYAGWSAICAGGHAILASHYALKGLLAVMALLVARRWLNSWVGAAFIAAGVSLSLWQLTASILVYHAALICFLAALAVADRSRVAALGFLLLAALTRLEYVFATAVAVGLWTIVAWKTARPEKPAPTRRSVSRMLLACVPLVLAGYVALHVNGWNFGGFRGWFAFQQHYAVGLAESGQAPGINPWIDYHRVTDRDFPHAQSLGDAFRVNRSAVLDHVGRNLRAAPRELARFFVTPRDGGPGAWSGFVLLACAVLAGAALPAGPRVDFRTWLGERRWSLLIAVAGLAALPPGLVVYAQTAYLLPAIPLVWALVAVIAAGLRTCFPGPQTRAGTLATAGILLLIGAIVAHVAPRPLSVLQPQPVRQNVAILRREFPAPTRLLGLAAESYSAYLSPGSVGLEPLTSVHGEKDDAHEATLSRLIERDRPDAILMTDLWQNTASFDPGSLETLRQQGWRKIPLADGALYLRPN